MSHKQQSSHPWGQSHLVYLLIGPLFFPSVKTFLSAAKQLRPQTPHPRCFRHLRAERTLLPAALQRI